MCRSIKTLRPPFTEDVSDTDIEAAARQYVRKIAGMRHPSSRNEVAFSAAVDAVAEATRALLRDVVVRSGRSAGGSGADGRSTR